MNKLILLMVTIVIGNIVAFFQLQSHYIWPHLKWLKSLPFILTLSVPCALLFFTSTKLSYEYFGAYWNIRLIGFGVGTIVFGALTWLLLHELPTLKNVVSILLALAIILLQVTNIK